MPDLNEEATWEEGITQIETTDRVLGGPNGKTNVQAGQLANRTAYLKEQQENHAGAASAHHDRHTPADILTDLKTVDGSGSGLDADLLDGKQATDFATADHTHQGGGNSPEPWTYVAPAGDPAPSYEWDWQNQPWGMPLRFYKHSERVYIEGGVMSTAPGGMGTVFFLPEGYRPDQEHYLLIEAVKSNGVDPPIDPTYAFVLISADGMVMIWGSGTGTADIFSLSNISFRVGAAPGGP